MQANARERTRVHTISAAFEALRRAVPSFSHGQRLSKLSILRVASAYIAALADLDSADGDGQVEMEAVDRVSRTLMTEGHQVLRRTSKPMTTNGKRTSLTSQQDGDDDLMMNDDD